MKAFKLKADKERVEFEAAIRIEVEASALEHT